MDGNTFFLPFEPPLMVWIQKIFGDLGLYIGSFFTLIGETVFLIGILGFLYWCYDKEKGKNIGVAIAVAVVWNPLVKNIALRRRPYMDHDSIKCLKAPTTTDADVNDIAAQGYSFPSGHSTNSACIYGYFPLILHKKLFKICAFVLPFLVGLSRVMLGVHYPTDVIVGWLMGYGITFLVYFIQKKIKNKNLFHLIIFIISCAGLFYCRTEDYFTCIGVMAGLFLAIPFEERFVNFENTRKPLFAVIRVAGGFGLFLLLSWLFKLVFFEAQLTSGTMPAFCVRAVRYLVVVFIMLGVYPMLFKPLENKLNKLLSKKKDQAS